MTAEQALRLQLEQVIRELDTPGSFGKASGAVLVIAVTAAHALGMQHADVQTLVKALFSRCVRNAKSKPGSRGRVH